MSAEETWTPPKLVTWISDRFQAAGLPEPTRLEAEKLVCHALGITRLDIYLQYEKPSTKEEQARLRELVRRRLKREPLAYIIGEADFWSLTLYMGPGLLIPRRDTEILIEVTLDIIKDQFASQPVRLLELGSGSGAIPLALATEIKGVSIDSVETSEAALTFAKKNLEKYQEHVHQNESQVNLIKSDRFTVIDAENRYDILISNPPYIPKADIGTLQPEVQQWEPKGALDGGDSGLDFIQYLAQSTTQFLKPGGFLIFEHGYDQRSQIIESIQTPDLRLYTSAKDYGGHDRVLVYQKQN